MLIVGCVVGCYLTVCGLHMAGTLRRRFICPSLVGMVFGREGGDS